MMNAYSASSSEHADQVPIPRRTPRRRNRWCARAGTPAATACRDASPCRTRPPEPTAISDWMMCQPLPSGSDSGSRNMRTRLRWYSCRKCQANGAIAARPRRADQPDAPPRETRRGTSRTRRSPRPAARCRDRAALAISPTGIDDQHGDGGERDPARRQVARVADTTRPSSASSASPVPTAGSA